MKPISISVQLYSVRDEAARDFAGTLKKIAQMGYVGVEPAGLQGLAPRKLRSILDDLGLVASSAHCGMPTKENLTQMIDEAGTLGYTRCISGFGADDFKTKEATLKTAAIAQKAAELLKPAGLSFGLHNHWCEFDHKFDGKYPHEILMQAAPDVFAQIDTYWAHVGGADPAKLVKKYGSRAPLLHIKDGPGKSPKEAMTAVGAGVIDWPKVIGAASDATEWLVVELDSCDTDMFEALDQSYQYLVGSGLARGNK